MDGNEILKMNPKLECKITYSHTIEWRNCYYQIKNVTNKDLDLNKLPLLNNEYQNETGKPLINDNNEQVFDPSQEIEFEQFFFVEYETVYKSKTFIGLLQTKIKELVDSGEYDLENEGLDEVLRECLGIYHGLGFIDELGWTLNCNDIELLEEKDAKYESDTLLWFTSSQIDGESGGVSIEDSEGYVSPSPTSQYVSLSSTSQFELSEEDTDNISTSNYTGSVNDEVEVIVDKKTGIEVKLTGVEIEIYEIAESNNLLLKGIREGLESGEESEIILKNPIYQNMIEQQERGKYLLKKYNLEAYKLLFGELKEEIEYYESEMVKSKVNFVDGELQVEEIEYYECGAIKVKENFVGGINGKQIGYYRTGEVKFMANFVDGKKQGEEIEYYKSGAVKQKDNYVNGKRIGYYESGEVEFMINFVDGEFQGEGIEYYESGAVKLKDNYVGGIQQGEEIGYYENGAVSYKTNYVDGKQKGESIRYTLNGEIEKK